MIRLDSHTLWNKLEFVISAYIQFDNNLFSDNLNLKYADKTRETRCTRFKSCTRWICIPPSPRGKNRDVTLEKIRGTILEGGHFLVPLIWFLKTILKYFRRRNFISQDLAFYKKKFSSRKNLKSGHYTTSWRVRILTKKIRKFLYEIQGEGGIFLYLICDLFA